MSKVKSLLEKKIDNFIECKLTKEEEERFLQEVIEESEASAKRELSKAFFKGQVSAYSIMLAIYVILSFLGG